MKQSVQRNHLWAFGIILFVINCPLNGCKQLQCDQLPFKKRFEISNILSKLIQRQLPTLPTAQKVSAGGKNPEKILDVQSLLFGILN